MFDERERKLLRAFSDVVRFEIEALHDRYETLKLKEHALHRALVRKGVVTIEEWNSAVTEASAEIAIQLATADITSGRVRERQAVTADLKMYWAAAQETDGAFLQPVLRVLIKMLNLPEEPSMIAAIYARSTTSPAGRSTTSWRGRFPGRDTSCWRGWVT